MAEETGPLRPAYVNLFPSDWKAGTAMMTDREEWTYLQICLHNWDKGEAMTKRLQPGLLGRNPEWSATVQALLEMDKVTATASGALMVPRAMTSFRTAQLALEKKSRSGKAGAKSRWKNSDQDDGANGAPPAGDLVFSVPAKDWGDFREHRRKIGAPMTARAEAGIIKKLEAIKTEHGHDPVEVIDQSIRKGWRDVFPLKGDENGNGPGRRGNTLFDGWNDRG